MNTAVIGTGMVGLVTALRLLQKGESVTLFERASKVGGLAASFCPVEGGDPLEMFYHHIFRSDTHVIALLEEFGIGKKLKWYSPRTTCLINTQLLRLDSPTSLLRFEALPMLDRIRLALAMGILKLAPNEKLFVNIRAANWLRAFAGERAYTTIFRPLFVSKFQQHHEEISLSWFWARIHDRSAELGYVDGGFSLLYETLAKKIRDLGGMIHLATPVKKITQHNEHFQVSTNLGEHLYDRVVSTLPVMRLAELTDLLPQDFIERYQERKGLAARCLVLTLSEPLSDAYWINVCDDGFPFMVVVEHTNMVDKERYGGKHILYIGNYGSYFPKKTTDELIDEWVPFLQKIHPQFVKNSILDAHIFVAADAQPIVTTDYRDRIAPHETPVKNLYIANMFQVFPHDRGQNYAAALAENLVEKIQA